MRALPHVQRRHKYRGTNLLVRPPDSATPSKAATGLSLVGAVPNRSDATGKASTSFSRLLCVVVSSLRVLLPPTLRTRIAHARRRPAVFTQSRQSGRECARALLGQAADQPINKEAHWKK